MTYASLTFDGTSSVLKFQVTIANLSFHMIETDRLAAYLAACSILALTLGPGIPYVTTRTIAGGSREGVLSALAFEVLKAYLYLGIPMIRRSGHLEVSPTRRNQKATPSLNASSSEPAPLARKLTGTWCRRQQLAAGMITLGIYVAAD